MKTLKTISILIIVAIAGGWMAVRIFTIHIPIGYAGVRIQQYNIFGKQGVVMQDFGPGWHRDLGPIDRWERFDTTVQSLEMTKNPMYGADEAQNEVKVQSADGYAVSLDVTVKYRIATGLSHKVYLDTGSGTKYKTIVRNEAERACMGLFGQMETEDFYNPEERRKTAAAVKTRLTDSLTDNAIEIIDVLIRDVQFDPEYENKIRAKKLADQEVELNKSMANAETMRGKTQVTVAETEKLVNIIIKEKEAELVTMQAETDLEIAKIQADYGKYVTEKKADADLIAAEKDAEGTRVVKKAEAEGEKLRNEALSGPGGRVIVALEAARGLNLSEATINTMETDLLDVEEMARKLGAPVKE